MSTLYCFFYLSPLHSVFFFFNDTATTEIYTLSYTTLFRSLRLPEQPVGDLGAPEEADALAHDRPEGARLRPARHPGGRQRRPRRLRCRARGRRSGARRRRSHADRVRDLSPGRSHDRRRSDQVPDRRRSRDVGAKGPSDPLPRVSGKTESPRDEPRAADRRGDRRGGASLRVGDLLVDPLLEVRLEEIPFFQIQIGRAHV